MGVVYIPCDSAAVAVGVEGVADAFSTELRERNLDVQVVRNGSRGMHWLEPLVEVETEQGRVAYGPVRPGDVPSLLDAGMLEGADHPLCHGLTEEMPFLRQQTRLTFSRCGVTDPLSIEHYKTHRGFLGLQRALSMTPAEIVKEVTDSGLRGRGGAGFPTGVKWNTVLNTKGEQKYIVCNADEGDSGTFSDRMIMEGDPFVLIEGMAIAGIATGATKGYIYTRSEYPLAVSALREAIKLAQDAGILGPSVMGSSYAFDMEVRVGAGAYVCGEETSLLNSLEGKRGVVRAKPPLPAIEGLFGRPTVVNNVISLATVPVIMDRGAKAYYDYGVGKSHGTIPIQLTGNIRNGGLFETAFGLTLNELIYDIGGGTLSGREVKAVQVGGPLGAYFPPSMFDTIFDYEAFAERHGILGHAGIVVFDDTVDMLKQARFAMEFCAIESCGKCTPCRIGSVRGVEVLDSIARGDRPEEHMELLEDLCDTMKMGSLCALGGFTSYPVMSSLTHFPQDFQVKSASQQAGGVDA
ncbi:NADP-reducing hydrogenase subunit HndC [Pseudovibrio axinellae]|uniref:NADP-reducing hydrogenase subunit HndC n=1 Tax=Pseudovibrio axinellae TaxID=989403 RepID=A0A161X7J2_9HYPH|nr:NADH-quinone oxidoreductase subunit NuoF [Pseudovibrio axinellae]KZL04604.1 NADP-reducing hydrogenase subunit HndC [Pseudovibrio axinellae]SEQ71636.1 formate dehydrogenase beta subunit [Pseudovibrio axinellae]